ncbi:MAG: DUF892 family protein [Saprospiraceae bacterium]
MKLNKSAITTVPDAEAGLTNLFMDELEKIYWTEKVLTKVIPKMIKNATAPQLIKGLSNRLEKTNEQIIRLEEVFTILGESPVAVKCHAMEGLIMEAEGLIEQTYEGTVRDACIIASDQKIEHYKIAAYSTLYSFATILREDDTADLLLQTLDEDTAAGVQLSQIAESSINLENEEDEETNSLFKLNGRSSLQNSFH